MNTIPVITSNNDLYREIVSLIGGSLKDFSNLIQLKELNSAREYLEIELPELFFIDFSKNGQGAFSLLSHILEDTWLLSGGIIALCDSDTNIGSFEEYRGANIVIILNRENIREELPKIINIIRKNRRILFQRDIGSDLLETISGSFRIGNDPFEAKCYTNLVCNFLYNAGRLDIKRKFNLNIALDEILMNAIEHGNCGITYEEKSQWLENNFSINSLINKKTQSGDIHGDSVNFEYTLSVSQARFTVTDQGNGFDWRNYKKSRGKNQMDLHGRGIIMARAVVDDLRYNEAGNEVTFDIKYSEKQEDKRPQILKNMDTKVFNTGDVVFHEGEESNYLYFIVKGDFNVIVKNKVIYTLTPDDIFVGEMSFLLNNRRSATVKAGSDNGKLIPISKKKFLQKLRERPHYALFLSRLLAQRLNQSNKDLPRSVV